MQVKIRKNNNAPPPTAEEMINVIKLFKEGNNNSTTSISSRLGMSFNVVSRIINEHLASKKADMRLTNKII